MLSGNLPCSYTAIPSQNIQMCCYKHIHKTRNFQIRILLCGEYGGMQRGDKFSRGIAGWLAPGIKLRFLR